MGFFDKVKGAMNFVTGGAATVTVEWFPATAMPGEAISVRVTATSTGPAISSGGVFVDVKANEQLKIPANALGNNNPHIDFRRETYTNTFPVAPPFQLGPNESRQWEGQFAVPANAQPSYDGPHADHVWTLQGRVEMSGNDPDSGWLPFRVGAR